MLLKLSGALGVMAAFIVATTIIFGDPVRPMMALIFGPFLSMGSIYWAFTLFGILGFVVSLLIFRNRFTTLFWRWAAITTTAIGTSAVLTSAFLTVSRNTIADKFGPDRIEKRSVFWSMQIGMPWSEPLNTHTHAIAMKDCKPFNWSWTRMSFLRLPHNIAINTVPSAWFEDCGIDPRPRP